MQMAQRAERRVKGKNMVDQVIYKARRGASEKVAQLDDTRGSVGAPTLKDRKRKRGVVAASGGIVGGSDAREIRRRLNSAGLRDAVEYVSAGWGATYEPAQHRPFYCRLCKYTATVCLCF